MGPSLSRLPAESALPAWARWSCIGLAIGFFVWNALYFFPYTVDDTFISLRYADNLVNGHGLVCNPGEQVEGFSNFLWVLVGALVLKLGLPVTAAIKSIGVASGALAIFLTYKLGRLLFAGQPSAAARSLLAGGLLAINLVDSSTGQEIEQILASGSHKLQKNMISVEKWIGRTVHLELIDSNAESSFAWMGISKVTLSNH